MNPVIFLDISKGGKFGLKRSQKVSPFRELGAFELVEITHVQGVLGIEFIDKALVGRKNSAFAY